MSSPASTIGSRRPATRAVRGLDAPLPPVADHRSLVEPIVQSATFVAAAPGEPLRYSYSRCDNPTVAAFERRLGAISDAPPAVAFASGLAALHALALATLGSGDHAIVGRASYGGAIRLFRSVLAPLGIRTSFVDARDPEAVERAVEPRTRLLLVETPSNPTLELVDLGALSTIARRRGIPLAVDNTFLTAIQQPVLELGAEVELLSTTKWIDGHHATIGGAILTRDAALDARLRAIRGTIGSIQAPQDAWLALQGLKTLPHRLAAHATHALEIARWLDGRAGVRRVLYPGLRAHPDHALARRQHRGGHGGVLSFLLDGGLPAAIDFVRALRLIPLAESLGGAESLLTHSATMTHASLAPEERAALGIDDGLLRLSVGLEDPEDLRVDLARGLAAIRTADRKEALDVA